MGTRLELLIAGSSSSRHQALAAEAERITARYESLLSRFVPDSDISRLNREGWQQAVAVDELTFRLLEECGRYHRLTAGCFDPALLPLITGKRSPDEEGGSLPGWHDVVLDRERGTVRLARRDAGLDAGAFGKGAALRAVRDMLRREGVTDALVNFGNSSILTLGRHPHGPHWPVGIPHLFRPTEQVHVFRMNDTTLSTSGASTQRRPRGKEEKLHIMDPRTGKPLQGWISVSVQHDDPLTAEVLSTALLVAGEKEGKRILRSFPRTTALFIRYDEQKARTTLLTSPERDETNQGRTDI